MAMQFAICSGVGKWQYGSLFLPKKAIIINLKQIHFILGIASRQEIGLFFISDDEQKTQGPGIKNFSQNERATLAKLEEIINKKSPKEQESLSKLGFRFIATDKDIDDHTESSNWNFDDGTYQLEMQNSLLENGEVNNKILLTWWGTIRSDILQILEILDSNLTQEFCQIWYFTSESLKIIQVENSVKGCWKCGWLTRYLQTTYWC